MKFSKRKTKSKRFLIFFVIFFVLIFSLAVIDFLSERRNKILFDMKENNNQPEFYEPVNLRNRKKELKGKIELLGVDIPAEFIEREDYLIATLSSGTTLLIKRNLDQSLLLASLQLIFKNIRIDGKWPLIIDLRFNRPILSY